MLLALDPAAVRTGYALSEPWSSGRPRMKLGSWRLDNNRTIQERVGDAQQHLRGVLDQVEVAYAFVEIPMSGISEREVIVEGRMGPEKVMKRSGDIRTQNQLWAMHGAVCAILAAFEIPYRYDGPKTWRKSVFSNGNMKAKEAVAHCRDLCTKLDVYAANDDERSAAAMMVYLNGHLRRWQLEDQYR